MINYLDNSFFFLFLKKLDGPKPFFILRIAVLEMVAKVSAFLVRKESLVATRA